jgi:hypothetical protein
MSPAEVAMDADVVRYVCEQTNPTPYATFSLRFRVQATEAGDRPFLVFLRDLEEDARRIATRRPDRDAPYDLVEPALEAWYLGIDDVGIEYVLRIPPGDLGDAADVQVVELFGGGRAQWVNEFTCEVAPSP